MTGAASRSVLARNTAYSVVGYAITFAIPVFMTPYVSGRLGDAAYGAWVVLSVLTTWIGLYDPGLWNAIAMEVAARRARGEIEGLGRLMASWFWFDIVAGAAVVGAVGLLGTGLIALLHLDPSLVSGTLLLVVATQTVAACALRHVMYTLNGLQRMDRVYQIAIVAGPLWAGGMAVALETGGGLLGLTLNNLAFSLVQFVAMAWAARREGYPLRFSPLEVRRDDLRVLLSFGWKLQAANLIGQLLRSDRLIMGPLGFPLSRVAVYQFGATVPDRLASSVTLLSSAVLPAATDLLQRGERERVRELLLRGTKYHALAAAGLLGFASLFGHELLRLWLDRSIPESVAVLRIMAPAAFLGAVTSVASSLAAAAGRPGLRAISALGGLGVALLLYMGAGRRYDVAGLAGAISGGLALAQVLFMIGFRGSVEFRWREYVGNALLKPLAAGLPVAAVYAAWTQIAPHVPPVAGRLSALIVLASAFALSAGLAWGAARATGVLDSYDIDVLKSLGRRTPA
jgi:O-antigen/teichoic acid export membrane protein